jgi:hypothetical protein
VTAVEDVERGLYGIQFHPEVAHTPYGQHVLTMFLEDICGCERTWSAASIIDEQVSVVVVSRVGDWAMGTTIRNEVMPTACPDGQISRRPARTSWSR